MSITLQGKDTTIQDATLAADLAIKHLERLRSDSSFENFYKRTLDSSKELTSPPCLPRYRTPPRKPGDDGCTSHHFATPQSYFRKQYFEALDLLINELKRRFAQERGLPVAVMIEKVLVTATNESITRLPDDMQLYENVLNLERLHTQLNMLPDLI